MTATSKKILKGLCIYFAALFLVPLLLTIGQIVSVQFLPSIVDGKGDFITKTPEKTFICTYTRSIPGIEYNYCDQKEFIANIKIYQFNYKVLLAIFIFGSIIIFTVLGITILLVKIFKLA